MKGRKLACSISQCCCSNLMHNFQSFMDNLAGSNAAFSIGNIIEAGLSHRRKPGDWYGPSTMIQIFEQLNNKFSPFENLKVVAFAEGVVYTEVIEKKMSSNWCSLILLIGFRLGLDHINKEYFPAILRLMQHKNFVGISGGHGSGALYIVGYKDKNFVYLDPHTAQPAVPTVENLWAQHLSYHCRLPLFLEFSGMNTSFAAGRFGYNSKGFICGTRRSMKNLCATCRRRCAKLILSCRYTKRNPRYPWRM
eukprot:TRINITY_DN4291_c0_g2_i1.p1 TRINITY_DN4291_c0_g2~~TRINITY_DN4291_c0_g2_i1.p1  ORF type:complete len:250 (+),score=8.45 TRINITY_DN4291_c0_g2_i1:454-1203(+)